jgi:hypothetical protein
MNRVVTSSLCATTIVPGGGVAAMPYGFPAPYGAMYGAPYGAPVGMNAYQAPTVWQGDHVVSGGQPEWAAEDAAQHALNLANWRIKLLQVRPISARCVPRVACTPVFVWFRPFTCSAAFAVMHISSRRSELSAATRASCRRQLGGFRRVSGRFRRGQRECRRSVLFKREQARRETSHTFLGPLEASVGSKMGQGSRRTGERM